MGRLKPKKASARKAAQKAGDVHAVSAEEREIQAAMPPLIVQGPSSQKAAMQRPDKPRTAKEVANRAWLQARETFDELPLVARKGDITQPEDDYGGLGASFTWAPDEDKPKHITKKGVLFRGYPACLKKGKSSEHVPKNSRPYMALLTSLITSMANVKFPAYWSRFSAHAGHGTGWHVDGNTRGAHPNAHRALDKGGWIRLCKAVHFRCSIILWKGTYLVPWGLDSESFRYMVWDDEGRASIVPGTLAFFWELVADQSCTIGLLNVCLVDLCEGTAMACPLVDLSNPCILPETSSDLTPMDLSTLMEQAQSNPKEDSCTYEDVGMDGQWAVWFGWRFAHTWCGEPWVRRYHIFGCPLRNVPMGQVRKVKVAKDLPEGHFEPPTLRHAKRDLPPLEKRPPRPKKVARIPEVGPVSDYEVQRLDNIARNQAVLNAICGGQ